MSAAANLPLADASVFLAVAFREAGHDALREPIARGYVVGSVSLVEVQLRLRSVWSAERATDAQAYVRGIKERATEVLSFDAADAALAWDAHERYGKGRGAAPAVLNYGDCMVYALAKRTGRPLLFKGDDFGETDLKLHPACQDAQAGMIRD